ncbi:hypothetical protein M9Y10_004626, partial [Tritrichomonas musculus]
ADIPTVINSQNYNKDSTTNDTDIPSIALVENLISGGSEDVVCPWTQDGYHLTSGNIIIYTKSYAPSITLDNTASTKCVTTIKSSYFGADLICNDNKFLYYNCTKDKTYIRNAYNSNEKPFLTSENLVTSTSYDESSGNKVSEVATVELVENLIISGKEPLLTEAAADKKYVAKEGDSTINGNLTVNSSTVRDGVGFLNVTTSCDSSYIFGQTIYAPNLAVGLRLTDDFCIPEFCRS